jgi:branched-chain amino acid transport system substrate-binding protein
MMFATVRLFVVLAVSLTVGSGVTLAAKTYGPGASDTEIKIGQTMPYSGTLSVYATIGRLEAAYLEMINAAAGINGRKIRLISLDDGYSPPRTVEQIRKLVEEEQVLFTFQTLGTPPNTAIQKYLNARKVPQLFVATGATKWGDPQHFPWTMGWQPNYQTESHIYAKYLLNTRPNAKIGVLYQNDDYGKDYLKGLKDRLGDKVSMIVKEESYEATDSTVDSQVVSLQASGADTFFILAIPKYAAQAIRKAYDIGWRPYTFLNNVSASVATVLTPAGLEKSVGIITALYMKDPTDPQWAQDRGFLDWLAFMKKWYPAGDIQDVFNVYAYSVAQTLVQVLKQCGDDLTRENIMRQAANLKDLELPMLLPGIRANTSPTDFYPLKQYQLARFNGKRWELFGELLSR